MAKRTIHQEIRETAGLATFYAKDGAFRTAAKIFRELADIVERHADNCDRHLAAMEGGPLVEPNPYHPQPKGQEERRQRDPINLQGSGPAPIEPRKER